MTPEKRDQNAWRGIRQYGNLGFEMVVAVLIGAWGGRAIDQWLGVSPWFLIVGFISGVAAGFLNLFRLIASEKQQHLPKKRSKGEGKKD